MSKPIAPSFDFGGSFIETATLPKPKPKSVLTAADFSKVPELDRETVLSKLKEFIEKGILKQSDKYHRIFLAYQPIITLNKHNSYPTTGEYRLEVVHWSDSAVFLDVFNNGGKEMQTYDFLNLCADSGAYTKRAWELLRDRPGTTPSDVMEFFAIESRVKYMYKGGGTKLECEELSDVLIEWNRNHILPIEELMADTSLNFIREHRRKGEIESTKCMNGECIGVIFSREMNF